MDFEFTHETLLELSISFPPEEEAEVLHEMIGAFDFNLSKAVADIVGRKKVREMDDVYYTQGVKAAVAVLGQCFPQWRELAKDIYNMILDDLARGVTDFKAWDTNKSAKWYKQHLGERPS
jgi:hypothetical protein